MSGRVYGVLVLGLALGCGLAWRAGAQPGGASSAGENAERTVRVELHDGALVGVLRDRVEVFEGIPYAAAPVGALRWALPQPAPGWRGDRDARSFGPSCMQYESPRNVSPGSREARTGEDCLTLNVWAPQGAGKAAVMVWLHGGGNTQGSSADRFYDGTGFARDGVVLVSLNYRLGIFGFLPYGGDANFGLWDQIAALRWVKANIAAFGGDPDNVTLFGESAGGQDVLALLTATAARGLFGKAIVESAGGGWGPPATLAQAQAAADSLLAALRSSLHGSAPPDLRNVPADAMVTAAADGDWGPVVDGHLLSEAPLEAFADGHAARIPLVIGTNSEEGSLLGPNPRPAAVFANLTPEDLARVQGLYGSAASGNAELAELLFRDGHFAGPAHWVAAQVARSGGQAYLYRFEYIMSLLQRRRTGAHHGSEIPFVFDSWPNPERLAPADRLVGRALHGCWASFARTGSPTCAEAPGWAAFGADRRWMVFDAQPSLRPIAGEPAIDLLSGRLAPAALRVGP